MKGKTLLDIAGNETKLRSIVDEVVDRVRKATPSVYEDAIAIRDGGGNGSIIGRNSFQRSREDALEMLGKLVDIYLGKA